MQTLCLTSARWLAHSRGLPERLLPNEMQAALLKQKAFSNNPVAGLVGAMPPSEMLQRAFLDRRLPLISRELLFLMEMLAHNCVQAVLLEEGAAPHVTQAAFPRKRLFPNDVRAALLQERLLPNDLQAAFLTDMVDP